MQIIQGPAGLLALAQDPLGIAEQQVAGFGELRLTATAIKQGDIQLLLRFWICKLTAGWVTYKLSAAFLKLPSLAIARRMRS